MRIAVFGSRKADNAKWPIRGTEDQFTAGAREIGRQLAHLGHTLLLGGIAARTADAHIVEGFVEVTASNRATRAAIEVIRPRDGANSYEEFALKAPHVFQFHARSEGWWEGAHLISIMESDAVLTIGGAKGTYLAGLAAIVAKKRLVPIGSFGGSSAELLNVVLSSAGSDIAAQVRKLGGPWTPHVLETALDLIGASSGPRLLLIHGRSTDWLDLRDWLRDEGGIRHAVVMGQQFSDGQTLPEKFEALGSRVDGAIALATPDDVGGVGGDDANLGPRARENVWIEVGWFWGRLGRNRLMLLRRGDLRIPTDLQGIEFYSYSSRPREAADSLRKFLARLA